MKFPLARLRRQQELETRAKLASILGEPTRAAVVPTAGHDHSNAEELERLAKRLRSAEDNAARLRNALRDQVCFEDNHGHDFNVTVGAMLGGWSHDCCCVPLLCRGVHAAI